MKKILITLLCLVLILSLSVSAFALESPGYTGHNYLEYQVDNYTENGFVYSEQNIPLVGCTVSYNKNYGDGGGWHPKYINSNEYTFTGSVDSELQNGDYIKWVYFPLGYFTDKNDYNLNHCISLNGLRSGTTISFKVTESNEYLGFDPADISYYIWIQYYDINGKSVTGGEKVIPDFHGSGEYTATFDIQPPDTAVAFRPYFQVQLRLTNISNYGWSAWNSLDYFQFRCIINETDYANNLTWYNANKESQLVQEGNKLIDQIQKDIQDIAFGDVEAVLPPETDIFEDIESAEQELLGKTDSGFNEYAYLIDDFDPLFDSTYGGALLVVSKLVNLIFERLPGLSTLVYTSLVLGVSAFVLSITAVVASRYKSPKETSSTAISRR